MSALRDYYKLLGVSNTAAKEDIQKAYRKLARRYHPDVSKNNEDAELFKQINEAHSTLIDPEKRKLYDRYGPNWQDLQHCQGQNRSSWRNSGYDQEWREYAGGVHSHQADNPFAPEELDDLLSSLFEGSHQRADSWTQYGGRTGGAVEAEMQVSLYDLIQGGTVTLSWVSDVDPLYPHKNRKERVQVRIPKGLKDGSVIRLAGKGERSKGGGLNGDLLLKIRVKPDAVFSLDGYDLITSVPVAPWEAALGAKVEVKTLAGTISLSVPAGCRTGRKLRVKGKGLPKKKGGAGDLIVVIETQVPDVLSEVEKRLFRELESKSQYNPRKTRGQRSADMRKAA